MGPRTSSLQQPPASVMSYFDFQPAESSVSPVKKGNVHCLDAFHDRPTTPFEYPTNASVYARRALPPLPSPAAVPALRNCSSSESMSSGPVSRPGTAMSCRQEKTLPPLPFRLQQSPSFDSEDSGKENIAPTQVSRPRQHRGYSFRSLLSRHSDDEFPLASPKSGYSVTRESRTDSVMGDYSLTHIKTNGTSTGSASSSRRPSALSLSHLKAASKKVNSCPPPMPSRPSSRKGSTSNHNQHRWGALFRTIEDDKEDVPPMPTTPGMMQDLSFNRCYYFYARNCNGYVLSGSSCGDACENCARSGFLGSP